MNIFKTKLRIRNKIANKIEKITEHVYEFNTSYSFTWCGKKYTGYFLNSNVSSTHTTYMFNTFWMFIDHVTQTTKFKRIPGTPPSFSKSTSVAFSDSETDNSESCDESPTKEIWIDGDYVTIENINEYFY
ncbi:hypothetical protein OAA60_03380 [Porticoccaceae bacterium]|jgi:hypothetical protein|nr:hypothetical protein [Porticoccaceae bacterium]